MRKGIKILAKVVAAGVLVAIFLPLLLALLLQIGQIQTFAVDRIARLASSRLGTTVRVDRLSIGFFNKLRVDGFYVEDFDRDTLLYASKVEASIASLGLSGGGLSFDEAVLTDALFNLKETPRGVMNVKEVVDRMRSNKEREKKPFIIEFRRLEVEGLEFRLVRNDDRTRDYGIDWADMRLKNLWGRLSDFLIDGSRITGSLDRLSGYEQSGFQISDFAAGMEIDNGRISLKKASILTPRSTLQLPSLDIRGRDWAQYKYYVDSVDMRVRFTRSSLASDDLAYFAPSLRDWHLEIEDADIEMSGTVKDMQAKIWNLATPGGTRLRADLAMRGLPDFRRTRFDVKLYSLKTNVRDADKLAFAIAHRKLPQGAARILARAGKVGLSGRFNGLLNDFNASAIAATDAGAVDASISLYTRGGASQLQAEASARNLRIGTLLHQQSLGAVTFSARTEGTLSSRGPELNVWGAVPQFTFNGAVFDSLSLRGTIDKDLYEGRLVSSDSKLNFTLGGKARLGEQPTYDFDLDLHGADLHAMQINRRDSIAQLALRLSGRLSGRNVDDLSGTVRIRDAHYRYNDRRIATDLITVRANAVQGRKTLTVNSEYAELAFRSKRGYKDAFEQLSKAMKRYLPDLYPSEAEALGLSADTLCDAATDYSSLVLNVKHITPITEAISSGLQVADSTRLNLLYNPTAGHISLKLESQFVERDRLFATNLSVSAMNVGDSLVMHATAEDFYAGALHLQRIAITGGARDNRFNLSSGFSDSATRFSGNFHCLGRIDRSAEGPRRLSLNLLPSQLNSGRKTWQVIAPRIEIDSSRIRIDRFTVSNADERLVLDGVASRSREDSMRLVLRNFDLSPLTQIAASMGYRIAGRSNGFATVKAALGGSEITADIDIDSMRVNDNLRVPPLKLLSRWDFERNRAVMFIVDRPKRDTVIRGYYRPSEGRYYARARIDSVSMAALDPILTGVISGTQGYADVNLILRGEHRNARLSGSIKAFDLLTTVDYTKVTYRVPEAQIEVKDNRLYIPSRVAIYDSEGNGGDLNFELNLKHLSNISYRLDIMPRSMLVMNTTVKDNELFYGKIYASGQARISGDKMGVRMEVNATTDDNSTFYMPLSGSSNVSKADFVTFLSADRPDTTDYLVRKKMMFERRNREKSRSAGSMDINLTLNVHPNVDFQLVIDPQAGDIMRGRGEGILNIRVNPRENIFEMLGDYEITEGSYLFTLQNIINKKFLIEAGSTIQWTGEPMDAVLNVNAIYKLKASLQPLLGTSSEDRNSNSRAVPVECVIHLGDRLSNPSKSFSIRVPQADSETQTAVANILNTEPTIARQFIYLLAFNSFYPENATGSNSNIGAVASAATGFELLANQLSNMLSNDYFDLSLNYRPKTETASDEVDFGFSSNLINNRLFIEVEGNYVLDNKQAINSQMSNFMGEAYVTWMIDREGALRLKGFTQTIDRFDETQGLQETGIGIYYKEDFDNLKDLSRRVKERFSIKQWRERRQRRRQERREQSAAEAATEAQSEVRAAAQSGVQAGDTSLEAPAEAINKAAAGETAAKEKGAKKKQKQK